MEIGSGRNIAAFCVWRGGFVREGNAGEGLW